jgi:hypothetical protein
MAVARGILVTFLGLNLQMQLYEMITGGSTQRQGCVLVISWERPLRTNCLFLFTAVPTAWTLCSCISTL